jgi:hypothetical protein
MSTCSRINFRSHAHSWQDALPVGNGRSGLLFFGGLAEERLIVNHNSCWLPREQRVDPDDNLGSFLNSLWSTKTSRRIVAHRVP